MIQIWAKKNSKFLRGSNSNRAWKPNSAYQTWPDDELFRDVKTEHPKP